MIKKLAYRIVMKDLMKCPMFRGNYDAKNGNDHFMYGISTIVEFVAYGCGEKFYDKFEEMFFANLRKSQIKAKKRG